MAAAVPRVVAVTAALAAVVAVVDLAAVELEEVVEVFTIDIVERDGKAYLSLQWDTKAYEVEIK